MNNITTSTSKLTRLSLTMLLGLLVLTAALFLLRHPPPAAHADEGGLTAQHAIPPEEGGRPRLDLSTMTVSPGLVAVGSETLFYTIQLRNTGSYTAENVILTDILPANVTYNDDAQAENGSFDFNGGTLAWQGSVGFDDTVEISFSVDVNAGFSGKVVNEAIVDAPLLEAPVTVQAKATAADEPVLAIGKFASPDKPGPGKPLVYTLVVTNEGQPANNLAVTVTDEVPANTTFRDAGPDGSANPAQDTVAWNRSVSLGFGETDTFTFSVDVDNVSEGTIIRNETYQVDGGVAGVAAGEVHTAAVVLPSLKIFKETWPDPPGSNRRLVYTLTVLNEGSLATDLVVTDRIPNGVTYVEGGSKSGNLVTWEWPSLATGETAEFSFTVDIGDVAEVEAVNNDYEVCSSEGVCQTGSPLIQTIGPATFEVTAAVDPVAKKPGGGKDGKTTVTPTLVVRNLGPGNAVDATARLEFGRLSVSATDLFSDPPIGVLNGSFNCGEKCVYYTWEGSLNVGEAITFTTIEGQSTIGGEEGTHYTATIVMTDTLSNITTEPVTATAIGTVTHRANLIPSKTAPEVIGPGQLLTYTLFVANTGLTTDEPPLPRLVDAIPAGTTLVDISDDGVSGNISGTDVVSWTLPKMGSGDVLTRHFTVQVDNDLISGTEILNSDYQTFWYEAEDGAIFSKPGQVFTTTVKEVGLIDSFKTVEPRLVSPGGETLTFYIHVVNSSDVALSNVRVDDLLPWENSVYQGDAVASGGSIYEQDAVSVHWRGSLAAHSTRVISLSVAVDPDFEGPLTNTAIIRHPSLRSAVKREAVAYVTDKPVLFISKTASPDPVPLGGELRYTIRIDNLGQQATDLRIIDQIPANTTYAPGSATGGGRLVGDELQWSLPRLEALASRTLEFRVTVNDGEYVVNDQYRVSAAEGAVGIGDPVTTTIAVGGGTIYTPAIFK